MVLDARTRRRARALRTSNGTKGPSFESPISGVLVAGVVIATAGLIGILLNATRPEVKTSR